jgi:hypothetical protein
MAPAEAAERGAQVDVLDEPTLGPPPGHARTDDDQRHADVGLERRLLPRRQAVLTLW